jgi:uncharacterized RDD family membrane protein YckC
VALHAPEPVAPLGRRFLAFFLDGFLLAPAYAVYAVVLDAFLGPLVGPDPAGTGLVVVAVDPLRVALELSLTLLTDAAYFAGCWTRWGMTAGQRACGVAVRAVGPGEEPPGGGQRLLPRDPERVPARVAMVRWALLQVVPLCLGSLGASGAVPLEVVGAGNGAWYGLLLVTALADPLRRGLHDRMVGTVVVRAAIARQA